jgi:hypothetical protein
MPTAIGTMAAFASANESHKYKNESASVARRT